MTKVGDIVRFVNNSDEFKNNNNTSNTAPAVVTAVFDENTINLKIFNDGPNNFWETSVRHNVLDGGSYWLNFDEPFELNTETVVNENTETTPENGTPETTETTENTGDTQENVNTEKVEETVS